MSRRNVRDLWHAEVLRTGLVGYSCRLLLLHMATMRDSQNRHAMTEAGRIRVPRERLAAALGVNPKWISERIAEATKFGLLVKIGGGHNGQVAQYAAQLVEPVKVPGNQVPTAQPQSLAGFVKVPANGVPTQSENPVPTQAIEPSQEVTKVPGNRGPYVRAHAGASLRPNRRCQPAPDGSRVERDPLPQVGSIDQAPDHTGRRINAAVHGHALASGT